MNALRKVVVAGVGLLIVFLSVYFLNQGQTGITEALTTVRERTVPALSAVAGLSLPVVEGVLPETSDFTDSSKKIRGRQLKEDLTPHEFTQVKDELKTVLLARPHGLSIQEQFAVEDIINFNCPRGFSVGALNGGITIAQINTLLDGNCGL